MLKKNYHVKRLTTMIALITSTLLSTSVYAATLLSLDGANFTTKTIGAAQSPSWLLWSNGYVENALIFPSEAIYTFEVNAHGTLAGGVWPTMEVRIDQKVIKTVSVSSTASQKISFNAGVAAGSHKIEIAFMNDAIINGEDRNLIVDHLNVLSIDPPALKITSGPTVSEIANTSAAITWSLSDYGTGQIQYGTTTAYGNSPPIETSFNYKSHRQVISGLVAGTIYHFRIISKSAAGSQVVSADATFKTLGTAPTPPPTTPIVNVSSCTFAAVKAAVDSAAAGTTINIPAGDCNWGQNQLNVNAGLYLKGAGQDKTIIRRVGVVSESDYLVAFNCSNGKVAQFSDIKLIGNANGDIHDKGLGLLNGCRDFKVFNSTFQSFIFSALYVGDSPNQRGVIYKNNFINNYNKAVGNLGYGVVIYGGAAWPALSLGSANAVFVEDNYFIGNRHNIASNNGSVYVFRYNTAVGTEEVKDYAMADTHGYSSSPRGSRSFEIYNNNFSTNFTAGLQRTAIGIRGGDGVIFNNTATAMISRTVELFLEDQHYQCGLIPSDSNDLSRSIYIWNNSTNPRGDGYPANGVDGRDCPASIRLNIDYFLSAKPGYVPYTYPHPSRSK